MKNRLMYFFIVVGCGGVLIWAIYAWAGQITLTTYYPAPTGNYVNLTVTGNTYLATNSGNVGIGVTSPAAKMEIDYTAGAPNGLKIRDSGETGTITNTPASWVPLILERAYSSSSASGIAIQGSTKASGGDGRIYFGNADEWDSTMINGGSGALHFQVRNAGAALGEVMTILPNGSVGIGNTTPVNILDITGPSGTTTERITSPVNYTAQLNLNRGSTGSGAGAQVSLSTGGTVDWTFGTQQGSGAANDFGFYSYGTNSTVMTIQKSNGYVGIGVTNPGNLLQMAGGGNYNGTQWVNGSSIQLKQDITTGRINPIKILDQVNIVNYRFKEEVKHNPQAPYHIGFIAEKTPELLSGKDRKGMLTGDTIGLLLAVVKQQQKQLDAQQKEIENLRQEVKQLKHATH